MKSNYLFSTQKVIYTWSLYDCQTEYWTVRASGVPGASSPASWKAATAVAGCLETPVHSSVMSYVSEPPCVNAWGFKRVL